MYDTIKNIANKFFASAVLKEEGGTCNANDIGEATDLTVSGNVIGDGESKTYSGIVNCEPYGDDLTIHEKECIGHVQKRLGTRLRELVKNIVVDAETKSGKKCEGEVSVVKANSQLN